MLNKKLQLQLFANEAPFNYDWNTQVTTQESLGPEMIKYYDKNLLAMAEPNLVHDQFGQKRPIPANNGKVINFRKFGSLPKALTPLTEGVTPDGQNLSVTAIEATVAQYGGYVTQSDVLELTALDNTILEATKMLGQQAGRTLDTITRDIIIAGTQKLLCPKVSGGSETEVLFREQMDGTSALSVKAIQKAVAMLRNQNTPTINGKYVGIIHPFAAYSLQRDPEWIEWNKYTSPEHMYNGEIGEIAGVRFVSSTEAKIFDGNEKGYALKINYASGYTGAITSVAFDGATVTADELIGKVIEINGVRAIITDNTASSITFASTNFGTVADNTDITITASLGGSVFGTLIVGEGAYGVTEVTGGGLQTIIKQKGSAGTADPLDQRSTIGWKAVKTAKILRNQYMVRVESTVADFDDAAGN